MRKSTGNLFLRFFLRLPIEILIICSKNTIFPTHEPGGVLVIGADLAVDANDALPEDLLGFQIGQGVL